MAEPEMLVTQQAEQLRRRETVLSKQAEAQHEREPKGPDGQPKKCTTPPAVLVSQ